MNLQRIKTIAERRGIEFKSLAFAINMSEGNLHRCVRENKIQARDLEKIATELNVSVLEFFDEERSSVHTEGNYSQVSHSGNLSMNIGDSLMSERVKHLEELLKEKDERIADLKERIEDLKRNNNK